MHFRLHKLSKQAQGLDIIYLLFIFSFSALLLINLSLFEHRLQANFSDMSKLTHRISPLWQIMKLFWLKLYPSSRNLSNPQIFDRLCRAQYELMRIYLFQ